MGNCCGERKETTDDKATDRTIDPLVVQPKEEKETFSNQSCPPAPSLNLFLES
jgi:hypothetical protein